MKRLYWILSIVLVLSFLLSACAQPAPAPAPAAKTEPTKAPAAAAPTAVPAPTKAPEPTKAPAPAAKPLKIGVLSDVGAGLTAYGQMLQRGFELGLAYQTKGTNAVAGRAIEVIVKDTEGKPDVGTQRARELIEKDGVEILVGTPGSAVALAVAGVAKEYKKIFVVVPAAADAITGAGFNKYIFRTGSNASQDALAGAKFAVQDLGKTFVGLAPDYSWGQDQIKVWKQIIEANGGKFVADVYAPQATTDFTPYFQKALDSKAEVLFVAWAGATPLFNQLQEQGVLKKMKLTTGVPDNLSLAASPGLIGNKGLIKYHYTFPKNAVNDWLVAEHQKKYNAAPDLFTDTSFAAAQAIILALEKTAGDTDAEKMIPVMEGMSWDAPKGKFTFRKEDHQALQPMYSAEVIADAAGKPSVKLVKELSPQECAPEITAPKQ